MSGELQSILQLPIETLALLAGGYLAYRLAYTGRDMAHKTVDVIMITSAFGFVTQLGFLSLSAVVENATISSLFGIVVALLFAVFWRRFGQTWARKVLRVGRVSLADGQNSAWDTMMVQEGHKAASLVVKKRDGTILLCGKLHDFRKDPHGPCVFGADGSIAMYVTDFRLPDEEEYIKNDLRTEDGAVVITYIPADEISEIRIWQNS